LDQAIGKEGGSGPASVATFGQPSLINNNNLNTMKKEVSDLDLESLIYRL